MLNCRCGKVPTVLNFAALVLNIALISPNSHQNRTCGMSRFPKCQWGKQEGLAEGRFGRNPTSTVFSICDQKLGHGWVRNNPSAHRGTDDVDKQAVLYCNSQFQHIAYSQTLSAQERSIIELYNSEHCDMHYLEIASA